LNLTAISGQENRFKDFTATPFNTTDYWSRRLFPPRNITTKSRGAGGRSTKTAISIDDDTTVATLANTVTNLQRSVEKLIREMAEIGIKVAKAESRGDIIAVKNDSLEDTQKVLSDSLVILVKGMKESKDVARKETLDSRTETSELEYMMKQLMNNNNSNNNRSTPQLQLTVNGGTGTQLNAFDNRITPPITGTGTTTEKRKHDGTKPSSSPKEKKISSPDHRKQQHHSNELKFGPPNSTVPIEIDLGMYTNNSDMDNMNHTATTLMRNEEDNNNDTEMGRVEETSNNASQRIGYIGSSGSFCSGNTDSDGTTTVSS
jgi:hypothetical protein